ncbi:hypothetical protein ACQKP9_18570, partial [Pseudomonas mandelii]
HYKIDIELVSPDYTKLEPFVKEKGLFSFYKDAQGFKAMPPRGLCMDCSAEDYQAIIQWMSE